MDEVLLDPAQCRGARALLGWTQEQLAFGASVGVMTVKRLESGKDIRTAQHAAILRTLVNAGALFLREGSTCDGTVVTTGVALIRRPPS